MRKRESEAAETRREKTEKQSTYSISHIISSLLTIFFGLGCGEFWAGSLDIFGSTIGQVQEKNWVAFWA